MGCGYVEGQIYDDNGSPLWSEQYGVSETCADCGAAVPTMDEHAVLVYDDDGLQRCGQCSENFHGLYDGNTGEKTY